jgi:hypothetical protein
VHLSEERREVHQVMHLLLQQVLFTSKVDEDDAMQEMHCEMERRAATSGTVTMAMIGAVLW